MAWAAGFFDGDGGFTTKNVDGRLRLAAAITQSPEQPNAIPGVLARFRGVVGLGTIGGPNPTDRAYYWATSSTEGTFRVFELLSPWLGDVKLLQFEETLDRVIASPSERRRPIGPRSVAYRVRIARLESYAQATHRRRDQRPRERSSELAWAAGFFDAEGSTYVRRTTDTRGEILKITAKVGQSTEDGTIADALVRFRDAVGFGYFNGPYRDRGRLPHYVWQVAAYADVVRFHELLDPWLGAVKREQADVALDAFICYRSCRPRGADALPRLHREGQLFATLEQRT